jgi:hypothetical protein
MKGNIGGADLIALLTTTYPTLQSMKPSCRRLSVAKTPELPRVSDPWTDRLIALGERADRDHVNWAINSCNCMVRNGDGSQMPARRNGKNFFSPEGEPIETPTSFEDMPPRSIIALMRERGETYIGHLFGPGEGNAAED